MSNSFITPAMAAYAQSRKLHLVDDPVELISDSSRYAGEPAMLWVDIETTGLDPQDDVILEICVVLTDAYGSAIDWHSIVTLGEGWEEKLADPDREIALQMHERSGLLKDLQVLRDGEWSPAFVVSEADEFLDRWLRRVAPEMDVVPMAGSSVSFDLGFVRKHMPLLARRFHRYRVIDASSFLAVARAHGDHYSGLLDGYAVFDRTKAHRAFNDIVNSIQLYRRSIFQVFPAIKDEAQ